MRNSVHLEAIWEFIIIEALKSSFLIGSFAISFPLVLHVLMNHKITQFFQLKLHLILLDRGAWVQSRLSEYNISPHMYFGLNSSRIYHSTDSVRNSDHQKFKWCQKIWDLFSDFTLAHAHYTWVRNRRGWNHSSKRMPITVARFLLGFIFICQTLFSSLLGATTSRKFCRIRTLPIFADWWIVPYLSSETIETKQGVNWLPFFSSFPDFAAPVHKNQEIVKILNLVT